MKKAKKVISKEEHVDAVINVKNNDPNMNDLEVNVPVSNPFDVLQIDPDLHSVTGTSTADKNNSTNNQVLNTTTFSSSSATASSTAPSSCSSMVTDTTGDAYSEKEATAEILAELKKFSNSIDKCIEEIRK